MRMNDDREKKHRGAEWRYLVKAIAVNGFLQVLGTWFAVAVLVAIGRYVISGDSLVSTWES